MQRGNYRLFAFTLLLGTATATATFADEGGEVFEPGDHCVAYRTIKAMWFGREVEVVGRSCEVDARITEVDAGSEVVVSVPIESLRSGNVLRNGKVADLLGVELQPDLRFTSDPLEADALREDIARGSFVLHGTLSLGEKPYPVEFPLEIVENDGRRSVKGRLETRFDAFEVVVPTVMGGFIADPRDELELIVHLDVDRVEGLAEWVAAAGFE